MKLSNGGIRRTSHDRSQFRPNRRLTHCRLRVLFEVSNEFHIRGVCADQVSGATTRVKSDGGMFQRYSLECEGAPKGASRLPKAPSFFAKSNIYNNLGNPLSLK